MKQIRVIAFILVISWPGLLQEALASGNAAHKTTMKFTYDEQDSLGPKNWATLPEEAVDTTNFCGKVEGNEGNVMTPGTPLNIVIEQATLPIRDIEEETELDHMKPSLKFRLKPGLEKLEWNFGYPADTYTGIEIRTPRLGLFQVLDSYDPVGRPIAYDFHFAFISFCDLSKASSKRSSHQLDGKRFPFEVNMVFFSEPRDIGIDNNFYPKNNVTKMIMISVLGELSTDDNPRLEPLLEAAKRYHFKDFDFDDTDDGFTLKTKPPFSPSWLLPKESQYFYYREGSFPVPPCFPIGQVYVFKDPIKISAAQLKTLTELETDREPKKKFTCTFGLLRTNIPASMVLYNPYPHKFVGSDNRPADTKSMAVVTNVLSNTALILLHTVILFAKIE